MHREVDNAQTRVFRVVRLVVCVAAEEHVVRRRLRALCRRSVVGILLLAREHICVGERSLLEDCQIVP